MVGKRKSAATSRRVPNERSDFTELPPGVTLLHTLKGHTNTIVSVAFDPQGRTLASGSSDGRVKLWDAEKGIQLRTLEGHDGTVFSVAFDPQGETLATGSVDRTVKRWETATGRRLRALDVYNDAILCVAFDSKGETLASAVEDETVKLWNPRRCNNYRQLAGHGGRVKAVAFAPDGSTLASASTDATIWLWNADQGRPIRTLKGHSRAVASVAFRPQGNVLASGSEDNTVKLWEPVSGRLLRTLEGHTGSVDKVAFSMDGRLLASKSDDQTIRLWSCATWETVAIIPESTNPDWWIPALAFHPTLPLLATAGSEPHTSTLKRSRDIHIWALDLDLLLTSAPIVKTVQFTNAKVVLVGDTGVGKSALAERLVHNEFIHIKSTHARRTLVLESNTVPTDQGREMHRETVLWDLAGQPAYRLVHQLSLDDAAVACVLFDARSETSPFDGAAYWSNVLRHVQSNHPMKKFLVASRVDVGGLPASPERIQTFADEHGFDRVFQTSACNGDGCGELLVAIRAAIDWDKLPAVSSSETLAALRDFVSRLKGERELCPSEEQTSGSHSAASVPGDSRPEGTHSLARRARMENVPDMLSIASLQQWFEADAGHTLAHADFLAYLKRLEDSDVIDLLIFHTTCQPPRPEDHVLLDPTRVDAYASALLVAAKDEPDGPGHLLETRVRVGDFKLEQSERLRDSAAEQHVLWYVVENLLARDLALRETIQGEDYLVFPAQCTSPLAFPGGTAFGVAFGMAGPVRSIYATLIAQLAHYEGFSMREFFQDAAAYHTKSGMRCLVRLLDNGDGTGEMQVSFDQKTSPSVRQGFLQFVEAHIKGKAVLGSLSKRHAYHCHQCHKPFADDVVKERLADRRPDLLCPRCESRSPLMNLLAAPTSASQRVAATIDTNAKAGRQRITAEWVIKGKKAQGQYDVFLSHNSKDKDAVEEIAHRLLRVGIRPWLDKWDLAPGDAVSDKLEWAIKIIPCAALFFGPADVGKWHIMEIRAYLERWASGDARMVPVILPNAPQEPSIPVFVRQTLWVDMREWKAAKHDGFYRLLCGILGRQPGDSPLLDVKARHVWDWQEDRQ